MIVNTVELEVPLRPRSYLINCQFVKIYFITLFVVSQQSYNYDTYLSERLPCDTWGWYDDFITLKCPKVIVNKQNVNIEYVTLAELILNSLKVLYSSLKVL